MNHIAWAGFSGRFRQEEQTKSWASENGRGELSRLLNAAVVSPTFCQLLLTFPATALTEGYNGEPFRLAPEDEQSVLSIQATSLAGFAQQLTRSRDGRSERT